VFKNALAQTPEAFAVISYAGVPAGFETLFPDGKQPGPLFFVFDRDGTTHWLAALKEGRIKAVVVPRPGANAGGEGIAGMPETIFERFCLLATPTNADEVAVGLKN
jgi:ABC-type sugar transport system substrate-binding protein